MTKAGSTLTFILALILAGGSYLAAQVGEPGATFAYEEDVAHVTGDVGTFLLGVENEDQATLAAGDKDYVGLAVTPEGNLIVKQEGSVTVTDGAGALNVICDSGCAGGTQYAEDAAHASGNTGTLALVVRNDAGSALAADGDNIPLIVNSAGALYVTGGGVGQEYTSDVAGPTDPVGATSLIIRDDALSAQESADLDWTVMRGNARGALWVEIDSTNALDVSAAIVTVDLGANNDVTVTSGTIDLGATDNAVLDTIADGIEAEMTGTQDVTIQVADGDVPGNAGVLTANVPRVTIATDDEINNDLDDIRIAVEVIDNAVATEGSALGSGVLLQGDDTTDRKNIHVDATTGDVQVDVTNTVTVTATNLDVQSNGADLATQATLATIDTDTGNIVTAVQIIDNIVQTEDVAHSTGAAGVAMFGIENEDLADLTLGDKDYTGVAVTKEGVVIIKPEAALDVSAATVTVDLGANNDVTLNANSGVDIGDVDILSIAAGDNNIGNVDIVTFPDNEPFNQAQVGGAAIVAGACQREQPLFLEISQTANTELVSGTASERIYICSFHVVSNGAEDVALISGTGTVCATSAAGVEGFGGATAATGWQFGANGGIMMNYNPMGHGRTDTDADNLCLFQSASGQVSGGLSYVSIAAL